MTKILKILNWTYKTLKAEWQWRKIGHQGPLLFTSLLSCIWIHGEGNWCLGRGWLCGWPGGWANPQIDDIMGNGSADRQEDSGTTGDWVEEERDGGNIRGREGTLCREGWMEPQNGKDSSAQTIPSLTHVPLTRQLPAIPLIHPCSTAPSRNSIGFSTSCPSMT